MLSVEDRYYKLNRILLKAVGLWPYQQSKWTKVQVIMITSLYLSAIFVQFAVFITHECTMEITLNVLSNVFPSILTFFVYNIYYFNSGVMKEIMEHIYYDWKFFKHKAELAILDDHAGLVKLLTEIFVFLVSIVVTTAIMIYAVPMTLDFVSSLNVSLNHKRYIETEYFVDENKYFYSFVCHMIAFFSLALTTVLAVGLALYGYGFHACAMFKITNYRMETTMDKNVLGIPNLEMEHVIYERIICAVNVHRRAIEYSKLLMLRFKKSLLFLIVMGVASFSISLFRFLHSITTAKDIVGILMAFTSVIAHFCFMFFANHVGQQVTDNNAEIFNTVYSIPWYMAPVNIQRLILFLLQKGNKNIYLSVGGVFVSSYEELTTLVTTSISYCTVIYAIQ